MRTSLSSLTVALVVVALLGGCSDKPEYPTVVVESVDPAEGPEGQATAVEVHGRGFHLVIESDLDDGTDPAEGVAVTVGGVALDGVTIVSETVIEGSVSATTPVGSHEVVVTFPDGRTGRLADGFRVYQLCNDDPECDDGDPCTTSERCEQGRCVSGDRDKDEDGDTFIDVACGGDDCDDSNATCGAGCYPGNLAADSCDGRDQDCDSMTDEDGPCEDGLIIDDPFGDGTPFAYVAAFDGMVYYGPSADGASVARTQPDGTAPESLALQFAADTTGNVSTNTATPPYTSIGSTGCTLNTLGCGPDNEDGRGLFTSSVLGGAEWLVMGGARSAGDLDFIYVTSSSAAPLAFRYVDMSFTMGPQTRGFSAAHTFNGRLYLGFPDTGGQRPYLVALFAPPLADPGLDATTGEVINLQADDMPGLQSGGTSMIDSMEDFNDRLYVANAGDWVRSTTNDPDSATAAPGDWVSNKPSAGAFSAKSSVVTLETANIEPRDKAVPQMAAFGGRLYAARNTVDGPQLWSCNPGISGDAIACDPDDWSLVAGNSVGDVQLSQFDNPSNTSIGALVATPTRLYVAYDNADAGVVVFRSTAATPVARGDFEGDAGCSAADHPASCEGVAGSGLGDPTNTRVFFGTALTFSDLTSVYLSVGSGADGVRIYRLQ